MMLDVAIMRCQLRGKCSGTALVVVCCDVIGVMCFVNLLVDVCDFLAEMLCCLSSYC